MQTYHIHIQGQVQGVGFRPFVYQLAKALRLHGWVLNGQDGVHIEVRCAEDQLESFVQQLHARAPQLSRITRVDVMQVADTDFDGFEIIHSDESQTPNVLLSPDFALCTECRQELSQVGNRRHGYPFITCTCCGPRYSITQALPYDRERTTMAAFTQCPDCAAEYADPLDRRYFSQTNSCPTCGIQVGWFDSNGVGGYTTDAANIIHKAKDALETGKILAVKGIGGFLLLVDARNAQALARLRQRKHRPTKPFALLYPDLYTLEQDVELHAAARAALLGSVAPIVLAPLRSNPSGGVVFESVAPGLNHAGVMLPYAPLLELLMQAFPHPVVATSGNLSNAPIVFEEEKALSELTQVADYVLTHNRAIATPQDDSVLRFSPVSKQPIWLRRSRGLAPTLVLESASRWSRPALAMGADMKSAFTLFFSGNTYVSQYLGELDNWDTQRQFKLVLDHLLALFQAHPEVILADMHPGYYSGVLGRTLAESRQLPLHFFQHHAAHFGAVLAEHNLFDRAEPILGVILDGTGMGTDGQIWGGEFFRYQAGAMERIAHLSYFPQLAGDKMAREPRISALALCSEIPEAASRLKPWFDKTEWLIYNKLATKKDGLRTSSTGRLLDGIAALCGLPQRTSYEGEAAMQLEELAYRYFTEQGWKNEVGYFCHCTNGEISVPSLLKNVLADIDSGVAPARIAAYVHLWLVNSVEHIAKTAGFTCLAFSGGVLQNAVLVELLIQRLGGQYQLFFHRELSPNDENISLGQLALYEETQVSL